MLQKETLTSVVIFITKTIHPSSRGCWSEAEKHGFQGPGISPLVERRITVTESDLDGCLLTIRAHPDPKVAKLSGAQEINRPHRGAWFLLARTPAPYVVHRVVAGAKHNLVDRLICLGSYDKNIIQLIIDDLVVRFGFKNLCVHELRIFHTFEFSWWTEIFKIPLTIKNIAIRQKNFLKNKNFTHLMIFISSILIWMLRSIISRCGGLIFNKIILNKINFHNF